MSGDSMRGCARTVPRPNGTVSNRWKVPRYKLSVHGRLCWSWLLFCWNCYIIGCIKGKLNCQYYFYYYYLKFYILFIKFISRSQFATFISIIDKFRHLLTVKQVQRVLFCDGACVNMCLIISANTTIDDTGTIFLYKFYWWSYTYIVWFKLCIIYI